MKLFNSGELRTTNGEPLEILKPGLHNHDAGPDFFNALVKIGDTLWAGNVEIHLKSSGWKNHAHDHDPAYDNVILHVVYDHDEEIKRNHGGSLPTLELKNKFDQRLWNKYEELIESHEWIPCQHHIATVDQFTINNWLDRLLTERLERKTEAIFSSLRQNNFNWEETFYHHLAKNFGFMLNALPFEMLAKSIPMSCLSKHKDHLMQIEALLFGQAGMLDRSFNDDYPNSLKREYVFLKNKFRLSPAATQQWKFLRLRPVNFPTIRIAQFAQLIHHSSHLFTKILECESLADIYRYFDFEISDYWKSHVVFDKLTTVHSRHPGENTIQNIVINTIVPFLFAYGKSRQTGIHQHRAIKFLEEIPEEKNSIISGWKKTGIHPGSAYHSQGLLQLKNEYCAEKKCLTCAIGNKLLTVQHESYPGH